MPYKVRFQRFIPGRPNLIRLPIKLVGWNINPDIQFDDAEVAQYYQYVDMWVTKDDFSPVLEIDTRVFDPKNAFKWSDLELALPDGMWLHRKYDKVYNLAIANMRSNYNEFLSSWEYPFNPNIEDDAKEVSAGLEATVREIEKEKGKKLAKKKKLHIAPSIVTSTKKLATMKGEGEENAKTIKQILKDNAMGKGKVVEKPGKKKK